MARAPTSDKGLVCEFRKSESQDWKGIETSVNLSLAVCLVMFALPPDVVTSVSLKHLGERGPDSCRGHLLLLERFLDFSHT